MPMEDVEADLADAGLTLRELLGAGTFGQAYLVANPKAELFVAKVLRVSNQRQLDTATNEIAVLSQLKHPNIIKYIEFYRNRGETLLLLMEYAEGGDLQRLIDDAKVQGAHFDEPAVVCFVRQAASALQYLHDKAILHRDLKPANCFLKSDGSLRLGDFGIARILEPNAKQATSRTCLTPIGTPIFMAAEITLNQPYGHKADMWALGCVIYNLCTLRPPFSAPTIDSLVLKIRRGQFDKRLPQIYSRNLMALVSHLIVVDPKKRLAAAGVLQMPEVAALAELLPLIPRRDHMHAQLESPSPTRLSAVPALAAAEATAPESPRNVRAYRSPPPVRRRPSLGTQLATAHERSTELSFGLSVERPGAPEPGRRDFEPSRSRSPALAHSPSLLSSSSSTTPLSSREGSPPFAATAAASSSSSSPSPSSRGSPVLASPTSSALAPGPRSVRNRGSQKDKPPSPSRATVLPALVTRKQPQPQQPQRLRERRNNLPEQPPPPPPPPAGSSKRRAPARSRSSSLTPLSPSESSTPEPPPAARSPKRPSHLSPMPPASPAHAAGKDAGVSPSRAAKGPYISRSPRRLLLPPMPSPSPLPGFDRSAERPLNKT